EFRAQDAAGERLVMKQDKVNLFQWPISPLLNGFNYTPDGYTTPEQGDKKPDLRDFTPKFKGLAFGDDIPNHNSQRNAFKDKAVYLAEYSTLGPTDTPGPDAGTGMADRIWPTQFNGGWQAVLRHVNANDTGLGWGTGQPSSGEIWLALEDLWVQRALLDSLQGGNDPMPRFPPTHHRPPPT